jgi:hypothetical protein
MDMNASTALPRAVTPLLMFAETGDGVVIMTNSDVGLAAGNALLNRIAEVYGWNYVATPAP